MATHSVIFDATAACRRSLEACLDIPCLMENEWAENQLADFNLWSAGAGASAKERASLDQRLILEPDIRSIVVNLLRMLNGFVVRCKQNALIISKPKAANATNQELDSRHGQTEDPSLNLSTAHYHNISAMQGDAELSKYQLEVFEKVSEDRENVRKTLHQISRLTVAIRKSGSHSRLRKADSSFDPSDHRVLRKHLELIILAKPSKAGMQRYQLNADALSSIQSRLIEANLRRRNRFLYAQRHSKKLADIRETHNDNHSGSIDEHVPHSQKPDLDRPIKIASGQRDTERHPDTLTATSASAVDIPIQIPKEAPCQIPKEESSQISKEESSQLSKTVISSTGAKIVYPRPPPIKSNQNIFKCPCCCQALPTYFSKGNKWRKHLMGDILPYTCIIDDCPNPWNFYLTRETWMKHMKEEHKSGQYWVCFACRNRNEFHEESVFANHLQTNHQGISPEQISTFISACSRSTSIEIRSCPICLPDAPADPKSVLDHVAEHVHSFSLRSLPWAPSDDTAKESDPQSGGNEGSYFLNNDYFGADSAHASSGSTGSSGTDDKDLEGLPELSFEDEDTPQKGHENEKFLGPFSEPELPEHLLESDSPRCQICNLSEEEFQQFLESDLRRHPKTSPIMEIDQLLESDSYHDLDTFSMPEVNLPVEFHETGPEMLTCERCGETFGRIDKLKDHLSRTHSEGAGSAQRGITHPATSEQF